MRRAAFQEKISRCRNGAVAVGIDGGRIRRAGMMKDDHRRRAAAGDDEERRLPEFSPEQPGGRQQDKQGRRRKQHRPPPSRDQQKERCVKKDDLRQGRPDRGQPLEPGRGDSRNRLHETEAELEQPGAEPVEPAPEESAAELEKEDREQQSHHRHEREVREHRPRQQQPLRVKRDACAAEKCRKACACREQQRPAAPEPFFTPPFEARIRHAAELFAEQLRRPVEPAARQNQDRGDHERILEPHVEHESR